MNFGIHHSSSVTALSPYSTMTKIKHVSQNNIRFITVHHRSPYPMRIFDESKMCVTKQHLIASQNDMPSKCDSSYNWTGYHM